MTYYLKIKISNLYIYMNECIIYLILNTNLILNANFENKLIFISAYSKFAASK